MPWHPFFTAVGVATTTYLVYETASFIWLHFLRPSGLRRYLPSSRNGSQRPWALVTGASDGIGKGFAHELLESGFNVVLHGRNPKKLSAVQESLASLFPSASIKTAVLDVYPLDEQALTRFVESFEDTPITLLCNNVGGTPVGRSWESLQENDFDNIDSWIGLNASFPAQLTRALSPKMTTPGLIINVSSACAHVPSAYLVTYAGTKAFITSFSASLAAEFRAEGKDIEVLSLSVASTANGSNPNTSATRVSARSLARHALGKVGSGHNEVVAHPVHALQLGSLKWLPESFTESTMTNVLKKEREAMAKAS